MKLHQVSCVGNRFLLVEVGSEEERDWPRVALEVCWGADPERAEWDGLLVLYTRTPLRLRMFNPDGTEDFCGNGLICAAAYSMITGAIAQTKFTIQHREHSISCHLGVDGAQPNEVTVCLPPPRYAPEDIPITVPNPAPNELRLPDFPHPVRVVNTGTPHAILIVEQLPSDHEFEKLSRALERHPAFPQRTSVEWVQPVSPGNVRIRIWERGVGETLGCGTGAAAVAAVTFGSVHKGNLIVSSRGGELVVNWPGFGNICVSGSPVIQLA